MTDPLRRGRTIKPRLAIRLVLILSIAIMPLGLISVFQTNRVLDERQSLSKIALVERTQEAVAETRQVIQAAITSAETLAILVKELSPNDEDCTALMERVVKENETFVFAGFSDSDLGLICASAPGELGLGSQVAALDMASPPDRQIVMLPLEVLGGLSTLSVVVPLISDDRHTGSVLVTVPISVLEDTMENDSENVDLVLFQDDGSLIATEEFGDGRRSVLPNDLTLVDLAAQGRTSFHAHNRVGDPRDFAVTPIVEGRVFALGSWEPQLRGIALRTFEEATALYFPFAMWAVAIIVAYVGVNRLVIRHVRELQLWMRQYANGTINLDRARLDNAPEELEVVAEAFRGMALRLSEQERRREDDLQEKTVLLREVHHRVKNNLQLISSILNMQIRATNIQGAKTILRQIQDRVLALSAIHRFIYMSRRLSQLPVDELLGEIIDQLVVGGVEQEYGDEIEVTKDFGPVIVTLDQAVPLSLLTAEAAMNAIKYCSPDAKGRRWIRIAFKEWEDGQVCLDIENSRSERPEASDAAPPAGSGLGTRLIQSFVTQLDGTLEVQTNADSYEIKVVFPLVRMGHDAEDETAGGTAREPS